MPRSTLRRFVDTSGLGPAARTKPPDASHIKPVSSNPATLQIILSPGPLFASPKWNQTTGFSTTLRGQLQASGRVQMSTNLVDWVDLANITSSGGVTQIVDPGAANAPRRFYRAVITP